MKVLGIVSVLLIIVSSLGMLLVGCLEQPEPAPPDKVEQPEPAPPDKRREQHWAGPLPPPPPVSG